MAIAIDQADLGSTTFNTSSTTVAFTTGATVAANGFIVLGVGGYDTADVASVAGGGLSWSVDKSEEGAGGVLRAAAICSAQAPAGLASGTLITATYADASVVRSICGFSLTGVVTSSPVDGTPTGPTDVVSNVAWATPSYAIAAGSILVAVCFNETNQSGNTITAPSVEAFDQLNAEPFEVVTAYRIETSAGSYTVAGTFGSAAGTTNVAVAYKAAAGGSVTGVPNRFLQRHSRMTSW